MFAKFQPTSAPFSLGVIHGEHFSVIVSRKSCFDGFEEHTPLPCLHLVVAADVETCTWEWWYGKVRPAGIIEDQAELRMGGIVKHFFGDALDLKDAAWRFERNSPNAARRQTVHVHLKIGHSDLFGEDGLVKQCVQSDLKPRIIAYDTLVAAGIVGDEQTAILNRLYPPPTKK